MDSHAERRQYTRVQLCAYGVNKMCDAVLGSLRCSMELVDISAGGARLKLKCALQESAGGRLALSVQGVQDRGRLQNMACQIRWRTAQEIGVQFEAQLKIPLSELQRIIG
ncbi:MAG: PilZ domain-containing protein [Proteobacteria bacterium]|nr:PilZ domain-containing protein [Pseudomonadota bacterium]MBU1595381.1 PilZ domain-containing protein [Pseudomonadota bacterium]